MWFYFLKMQCLLTWKLQCTSTIQQIIFFLLRSVVGSAFLFPLLSDGLMFLWHQESSSTHHNFIKWNKKYPMIKPWLSSVCMKIWGDQQLHLFIIISIRSSSWSFQGHFQKFKTFNKLFWAKCLNTYICK